MSLSNWLCLMLVGAVGVGARGYLGQTMGATAFPWATLIVNGVGGLAMGLVQAYDGFNPVTKTILGVGLLGGMTTFSAFSWECFRFLQTGQILIFAANVLANTLLSIGLCALGFFWGKSLTI